MQLYNIPTLQHFNKNEAPRYHRKGKRTGRILQGINQGRGRSVRRAGDYKNTPDGNVFIEAEGDKASLEMFLDWCHEGPQEASVTSVESHEGELKNYRNFEVIKRGLFK